MIEGLPTVSGHGARINEDFATLDMRQDLIDRLRLQPPTLAAMRTTFAALWNRLTMRRRALLLVFL